MLALLVCFPGLLDGLGAGLSRGRQRCFSLRVIKVTLVMCKGDGYLQLAPLLSEAQAFGLKERNLASKLHTDPAHRIRHPWKNS